MGQNELCSWDDEKAEKNVARHNYDFSDISEVFDGRFIYTVEDDRKNYGEKRFVSLVEFREKLISVTFTPRDGKARLISVRRASRTERKIYHATKPAG